MEMVYFCTLWYGSHIVEHLKGGWCDWGCKVLILSNVNSHIWLAQQYIGLPRCIVVKNPPVNAGDLGSVPGLGRSLGVGNGNPLQYSCLRNPLDRGAWWATVRGVAQSWTRLSAHECKQYTGCSTPGAAAFTWVEVPSGPNFQLYPG